MEVNKDLIVIGIGYILAVFFSIVGIIYGAILYFMKKDTELYYDHSKTIVAVGVIFIILRLFATFGRLIF